MPASAVKPSRPPPMADPVRFETLAAGLHRVSTYHDARAVLADPGFIHWLARDGAANPTAAAIGRWLDAMDPRHGHPARTSVLRALSSSASQAHRPELERLAEALLTQSDETGSIDVDQGYGRPLTRALVAQVLGLTDQRDALDRLVDSLGDQIPGALFPMMGRACDPAFFAAWNDLANQAAPGSLGAALSEDLTASGRSEDLGIYAAMFAFAATDNIARFIARAAHGLAAWPETWRALAAEPSGLQAALEEWLRFSPPLGFVHLIARGDTADTEVHAGDSILVALEPANRDPAVFEDPDRFDPARNPRHLAFGSGPLACVGASVARMLAQVAISRLLAWGSPQGTAPAFPHLRLNRSLQPRSGALADAIT